MGIEFHSLSKSYNMTGWRHRHGVGNAELIRGLMVVKSNLDSGVPQAIQHMGIEALKRTSSSRTSATPSISDAGTGLSRRCVASASRWRPRGRAFTSGRASPRATPRRSSRRSYWRRGRRGLAGPGVRRARRGLYPAVTDHLGRGVGEGPRADSLAEHSHGLVKEGAASQGLWSRPGAALSGCSSSASSKRGAAARGRLRTPWTSWPSWRVARAPRWWAP